jgi:hypothetical protein
MRSIPFKTVFDKVVRLHGRDPRQPLSSDLAGAVVDHINDRVHTIAQGWRWPEWEITEERAFRQIWNAENQYLRRSLVDGRPDEVFYLGSTFDVATGTLGTDSGYYRVLSTALGDPPIGTLPTDTNYWVGIDPFTDTYISYDQGCQRSIGIVRGVYKGNPCCGSNGVLNYMPTERGISVCGSANPTVFIKYSMPIPSYTMTPYVVGKTYARGSVVFDPTTGECFQAIASTTAVPTNVTFWRWIPFLDVWSDYAGKGAFADSLMEFDQGGNAELQAKMVLNQYWSQQADDGLQAEVDALVTQGQKLQWSFCKRTTGCMCESETWSGGTVTTLTDECKDGLGWVYPTQPVTPTEELGAEIRGITPMVMGQEFVDVTFSEMMANTRWILVEASVVNSVDGTPLNIWAGILTSRTTTGFRLQLNGIPDTDNYYLHWAVRAVTTPGEPVPTYDLSGPTSGRISVAATFTVELPIDLVILGVVTVTPSDMGGGGVFSPTSVTMTVDDPAATFTYTPGTYGTKIISTTNDRGLTDPDAVSFISTATSYTLSGPSTATVGVASAPFTVALPVGGALSGTMIVTPSDGGAGGTFTPATVTLSTAVPSITFTYTGASNGAKTISVTNNRGLTNPGNLTCTLSGGALVDGDPVSSWADSSGNGHTATMTGSNRPTYKTAIVNGKPVVRFTAAGFSKLDFTAISGVTPFRVFAVIKQASAGNKIFGIAGNSPNAFPYLLYNTDNNIFVTDWTGYTSTSVGVGGPGPPTFGFHVLTSISTAGTLAVRVDGAGVLTALGALANTGNFASIGYENVTPAYGDGDVAEIILYNVDVSTPNLQGIEKYLGTKYGITVAGGTAVDPLTVTGLVAWWKADSGVT